MGGLDVFPHIIRGLKSINQKVGCKLPSVDEEIDYFNLVLEHLIHLKLFSSQPIHEGEDMKE